MISVHEIEKLSLQQIGKFLTAAKEVRFEANHRKEVYGWVERLLCQQEYGRQGRRGRGLLRRYLAKMTGLSRAQVTRLFARYVDTGQVRVKSGRRHRFPQRYTRADIELLAQVDEAHQGLSGPATRRILEREFREYGKVEFERLAAISNGHLTTNLTVTICEPGANSVVLNPVHIIAKATDSTSVNRLEVWVDGTKAYQAGGNSMNAFVSMTRGTTHRIAVQAVDSANRIFKQTVYAMVQ